MDTEPGEQTAVDVVTITETISTGYSYFLNQSNENGMKVEKKEVT